MAAGRGCVDERDFRHMSKRTQIQRRLRALNEIGDIMEAMKNISLIETHKLARVLTCQHRVLESIEAAAADFMGHHLEITSERGPAVRRVLIAVGSQRGFCGDFNDSIARALYQYSRQYASNPPSMLVVGRRLAPKLGTDLHIIDVLDGPSVVEEVQPVLQRVMDALTGVQRRGDEGGAFEVTVFAHREGEEVAARPIVPRPASGNARDFSHPPLLNLSTQAFFYDLVHHYLWAQMHDVFYTSLMAENRRRLQHMEGATKRMEEKSNELLRKYNALRQEEITEEIEVIMLSNDALQKRSRSAGVTGEA
jgi:F-type H+-transporting ATPase subunit gamma